MRWRFTVEVVPRCKHAEDAACRCESLIMHSNSYTAIGRLIVQSDAFQITIDDKDKGVIKVIRFGYKS